MTKNTIFTILLTGLLFSFSVASAADSVSLNFATDRGNAAPTSTAAYPTTLYGAVPVLGENWNNFVGQNSDASTPTIMRNNLGESYFMPVTWSCSGLFQTGTAPDKTRDSILYNGYLDDGGSGARISAPIPYFSYDLYLYAATDNGSAFRAPTINGNDYTFIGGTTVQASGPWGNPGTTRQAVVIPEEGVNYLHMRGLTEATLSVAGKNRDNLNRGCITALQIVNSANSISSRITAGGNWSALAWQNDLTDEAVAFSTNNDGLRLILDGGSHSLSLGGNSITPSNLLVFGDGTVRIAGGTLKIADGGQISTRAGANLQIENLSGVPAFAIATGTSVLVENWILPGRMPIYMTAAQMADFQVGDVISYRKGADGFLTGVYSGNMPVCLDASGNLVNAPEIDGSTFSQDSSGNYRAYGATAVTVSGNHTINSLRWDKSANFEITGTVTLSAGSIMATGSGGWMTGTGSYTSALRNDEGTYDLYVATMATGNAATRLRLVSGIADNGGTAVNLIKAGSTVLVLSGNAKTYTGDTVVQEGTLYVCLSNIASPRYEVASAGTLRLGARMTAGGGDETGTLSITTGGVIGTGNAFLGYAPMESLGSANRASVTLNGENFTHDGSVLNSVTMQGPDVTLTGTTKLAATTVTLGSSSTVQETYGGYGTTTLAGDAVLVAGTLQKGGNQSAVFDFTGGTLTADKILFSLEQKGGTLAPGGIGTVGQTAIDGNYTVTGGGMIQMDVFSLTDYDKVTATGDISFGAGTLLDIFTTGDGLAEGDLFQLFLATGDMLGMNNLQMTAETLKYWDFTSTFGEVQYLGGQTPSENGGVPEPATWVLLMLGLAGMGIYRRNR